LRILAQVDAAATRIEPPTLNVNSNGRSVNVFVELPPGVDPYQTVLSSVRFQNTVATNQRSLVVGDFNSNGIPDMKFVFDRGAVTAILPEGDHVPVTVTGEVRDQAFFTADRKSTRLNSSH